MADQQALPVKRDNKGRIKKGSSGNPKGRRLGSFSLVAILKKKLQEKPENERQSYAHLLIKKMLEKGVTDGDTQIIKDIFNRVDGLPQQSLEVSGGLTNKVELTDEQLKQLIQRGRKTTDSDKVVERPSD